MAEKVLKVMIVEDATIYIKVLRDILGNMENVEVIDTAVNGDIALRKIAYKQPDLVLLDIEMPILDGISTLVEIKKRYPDMGVIMVSGITQKQTNITVDALQKGAFDFVAKPTGKDLLKNVDELRNGLVPVIEHFIEKKIMAKSDNKPETKPPLKATTEAPIVFRSLPMSILEKLQYVQNRIPNKINVVLIGSSTGGPAALHQLIPLLPGNLNVPILLVQHMPPVFTKSLAEHLNKVSPLNIVEASDDEVVKANNLYIAPGGCHMTIKKVRNEVRVALVNSPPVNSCRPAVDVLYESATNVYTENILSVILTGMGSDGLNGVIHLKSFASCYSITQSPDSCVVYGMPRMVDTAGLSDESVHLDDMARRITEIVKHGIR